MFSFLEFFFCHLNERRLISLGEEIGHPGDGLGQLSPFPRPIFILSSLSPECTGRWEVLAARP